MYAIFLSGGKQYKVIEGQEIKIEKIKDKIGNLIQFKKVLVISKKKNTQIGSPFIKGGIVEAKVNNHIRDKKIVVIKFKRRKHYKKKQGHRQWLTKITITKISKNKKILEETKNGS
ncbi:50S ribosomal protein L21 [Buchnera aphidicola (Neophyllaphis podocarpi)]|uniref:50S ribosomal protein L21 n=1 Tax=Buchnera aphidicola TaxID=9 RepID=UPI0031B87FDD